MVVPSRFKKRPSSPSMAKLQFKLARIVSRQDELKVSFNQLKAQIHIGLLEAEHVFSSLAIPLMKLVGMKTNEMEEEGRSSSILMNFDLSAQDYPRNESRTQTPARPTSEESRKLHKLEDYPRNEIRTQTPARPTSEESRKLHKLEEDYATRGTVAGKEFIQKQRLQLVQLVDLLKKIESRVNSSQSTIFQTIDDHKASIHTYFQKAISYVASIHQSSQENGAFLIITLKLIKAMYNNVRAVLGSIEGGVDDLMHELAEEMCTPMVEYVKNFKAEMSTGTCQRLFDTLEEMGGAVRDGRLELEQARVKVKIAEDRKREALHRLKESEERVMKMKEHLGFYLKAKSRSTEHFSKQKFLGSQEDQTKDDNLLWELLEKKRKHQSPGSPFGPHELLSVGINKKQLKSSRGRPSMGCRPVIHSYLNGLSPQTPASDCLLCLGSSPSATRPTTKVLSQKRITP